MDKVCTFIINWNNSSETIQCLENILPIINNNIFILDNNSNKNDFDKIIDYLNLNKNVNYNVYDPDKSIKSDIILVKSKDNLGFAEGNNYLYDIIKKNKYNIDYILLLNNDVIVDNNFLEELITTIEEDKNNAIVGPLILYYEYNGNQEIINIFGGDIDYYLGKAIHLDINKNINEVNRNNNRYVNYIEGSCMLIRKNIIDKYGFFKIKYFAYWEEIDFCSRIKKNNHNLVINPKSIVWHKISKSIPKNIKKYFLVRNRIIFIRYNSNTFQKIIFFFYYFFFDIWKDFLINIIYYRDLKNVKYIIIGTIHGFTENKI